jgi:queuine tRNA-ribosyltransferase
MLMTEHNINFYQQLMDAIAEKRFAAFASEFRARYASSSGKSGCD